MEDRVDEQETPFCGSLLGERRSDEAWLRVRQVSTVTMLRPDGCLNSDGKDGTPVDLDAANEKTLGHVACTTLN